MIGGSKANVPSSVPTRSPTRQVPDTFDAFVVFLQEELRVIYNSLNLINNGSLLKPTSMLPERPEEGLMKLFVRNTKGELPQGISSEGLWIFVKETWVRIRAFE